MIPYLPTNAERQIVDFGNRFICAIIYDIGLYFVHVLYLLWYVCRNVCNGPSLMESWTFMFQHPNINIAPCPFTDMVEALCQSQRAREQE